MNNTTINKETNDKEKGPETFLNTMIMTFITVFIAELGDKTQIATLLLSAGSGKPILVFVGAAIALICTSLLGVVIGTWLSEKVSESLLSNIAGSIMLFIGLYLISEVFFPNIKILAL